MSVGDICFFARNCLLDEITDLQNYKAHALSRLSCTKRLLYQCVVNQLSNRIQAKKAQFSHIHRTNQLTPTEKAFYQNAFIKQNESEMIHHQSISVQPIRIEFQASAEKKSKLHQEFHPKQRMGKLTKWSGTEELYKRKSPRRLSWKVTQIKGRRTGSKRVTTPVQQQQKVERMERLKSACSRWRRSLFSNIEI